MKNTNKTPPPRINLSLLTTSFILFILSSLTACGGSSGGSSSGGGDSSAPAVPIAMTTVAPAAGFSYRQHYLPVYIHIPESMSGTVPSTRYKFAIKKSSETAPSVAEIISGAGFHLWVNNTKKLKHLAYDINSDIKTYIESISGSQMATLDDTISGSTTTTYSNYVLEENTAYTLYATTINNEVSAGSITATADAIVVQVASFSTYPKTMPSTATIDITPLFTVPGLGENVGLGASHGANYPYYDTADSAVVLGYGVSFKAASATFAMDGNNLFKTTGGSNIILPEPQTTYDIVLLNYPSGYTYSSNTTEISGASDHTKVLFVMNSSNVLGNYEFSSTTITAAFGVYGDSFYFKKDSP